MAFQFREKALRKQAEIEQYCRELGLLDETEDYLVKEELGSQQHVEDDEMNDFVMNEAACDGDADDGSQNDDFWKLMPHMINRKSSAMTLSTWTTTIP